jgi:hypothetical protein
VTEETTDLGPGPKGQSWNHPSPEELSAYQANELTPEQDEAIQEHLADCSLCAEVLLDLERFLDLPEEDRPRDGVADFETAAEWGVLRSKLKEEGLLPGKEARRSTRRGTYAVAATILLAIVGLSLYTISRSPERFQTLKPLDSSRGPSDGIQTVQLPVTLLLKSPVKTPYPEYRAELWDRTGHRIREFPHLKESRSFDLEVPLGRDFLDPGEYRIELIGLEDGHLQSVGEYAFKVVVR